MIKPKCTICNKELHEFGGIILSPPVEEKITKEHTCTECHTLLERLIEDLRRFSR